MKGFINYNKARLGVLALLIWTTAALGPPACSRNEQPRTVADILTSAGQAKRDLRAQGAITAQTDYDISFKLAEANRAYKNFINDELARLAATGTDAPDPNRRSAALRELASVLRGLENPEALGIKSADAQKTWRLAITSLGTVIEGIELLGGK